MIAGGTNMTKNDRNEMNRDFEEMYKREMKNFYLKWRQQYSPAEVSEMFFYFIAKHRHEKIMDLVNKRKHRKLKYRKVKAELDNIKTKAELDNFAQEIR